jgi:hypothetical protein
VYTATRHDDGRRVVQDERTTTMSRRRRGSGFAPVSRSARPIKQQTTTTGPYGWRGGA